MKNALISAVASLLLAIPLAVHAQVITYDDPANFVAASTGDTSYSFPDEGSFQQVASPYTLGPLTFSSTNSTYALYIGDDGVYGSGQTYLDTFPSNPGPVNSTITLNGATALAFTVGTEEGAQTVTVDVNGIPATIIATSGAPTSQFFGITDSIPITSVSFSTSDNYFFDVLNFEVGSAVPEPSTWMMMCSGLGMLVGFRCLRWKPVLLKNT